MELFIPGIAVLLLAALIVFLVLPRFGAPVLVVLSIILLVYGVYTHASMFAPEYRLSTWTDIVKQYAPFVIIGALLVSILMYMGFLFSSKGAEALPVPNVAPTPNLPPADTATNPLTAAINSGLQAVNQAVDTATNVVSNVTSTTNKKNNSIFNINSLVKTPRNNRF